MRKFLVPVALISGLVACGDVPTAPRAASEIQVAPATREESHVPIPGKYIVRFKDTESNVPARGQEIERLYGAVVERTYSSALKGVSVQLADAAASALSADPAVLAVEQDVTLSLTTTQSGATWGLDRIDQRNLPLSTTYTYGVDGSGVTVYIIDTGINFTHNEYAGRAFTGIDEITSGGSATDCNGHGSHVSGTVGGTTYGVAKKVKLVAVRVLDCSGSGSTSGVIAGIDWVTQHATLPAAANMSLGGGFSSTLNAAVTNSINAGIVYGVAAGNSAGNACLESPSSTPSAIVVGATTISDAFASFSNFGSCVKINAPGVGITSAWIGSNTATNTISGTSMATPHVVGAVALYLQSNPTATPAAVRTALTSNATSGIITGNLNGTPNLLLYTGFIGAPTPPVANFTSSCTQLVCSFDGSSSQALPSATYAWTFGDATSGSGKTVSHTYAAGGTYTVTLTVTDANGTNAKTASVVATAPTNQPPVASITAPANNSGVVQGTSVTFSGTGNDPEDGVLSGTSLAWTSSRDGAIGTGTTFAKSNLSVGVHTITLTATDSKGATGAAAITLTVNSTTNQPPVANFTANCVAQKYPNMCSFDASSSTDDVGIVSYLWSWPGDGNNIKTPVHVFPTAGPWTVTLTVTDGGGLTSSITKVVGPLQNQPPTAAISAPANNTSVVVGTVVSFAGTGSDPEDGVLSGASLVWTSNLSGQIGTGTSFSTSALPVGSHTITLTATDSKGATGAATITVIVTAPNQPPTAAITAPANNTSVVQGTSVAFAGTGTDPEDGTLAGASLVWTSSINGQIGTGVSFATSTLSVGAHTITLTATDSKGATGTATRTVIVTAPNQPPTAAITAPANNTSVVQGTSVAFAGTGSDPEDGVLSGASLVWTSSIGGQIGTGTSFSTSTLAVGTHTITLTATDSKGATGAATITVIVTAPNQPPTAAITAPANNTSVVQGASVAFAGTGTDPEDGTLTGASLVWTSNLNGQIGTGTSFSTTTLSVGTHTITLIATDSKGATGTATLTITVTAPNQPPTASISAPSNGSSALQGTSVSFAGSGSDPEDGVLTGASLVWTSSINGQIGTGNSFATSTLSVGTHTITLTAKDSKGATGSATITFTITAPVGNQPPVAAISSIPNGATFKSGAYVFLGGSGTDPEDGVLGGASMTWSSSINGLIGTGPLRVTNVLTVGTHTITLTVKDSQGATNSTTRTITITAATTNQPPVPSISAPVPDQTYTLGQTATFVGAGGDPEDGTLTGASLVWSTPSVGVIGTGGTVSLNNLPLGNQVIALMVTDSKGLSAFTWRTVKIVP